MNPQQIFAWAASGESETLEFKKSTAEKDRACRTLCAFVNGQGGRLLFGVTPSGKPVGQTVADNTLEELAREFQGFEPPLFPLVERVSIGAGREVLVLTVARSARAPVAFRGVAYERVLNTTRTIARLMRDAGHEPPTVSVRQGAVIVTFGLPGKTPQKMPMKTTGKTTGKTPEAVLRLLADDPNLSAPQLAARLEKSELTTHRAIRKLRESNRLVRVGPDKGGRWEVLE